MIVANWIDKAIETVAPSWAVERAYARWTLDQARAYDAGKVGRRTEGWRAPSTSANAEIGPANTRIRARVHDLVRNNPYAAQAVRKMSAKAIGSGIVPRLRASGDEVERKQAAADYWRAFVDNCDPEGRLDFYGQQELAMRTVFESGEALVRLIPRPSSWKLRVPLQIQVLEPDYLDGSRTESLANGGAIIQGVEYDADGRRVAYWLFDEHPGDALMSFARRGFQSRRTPASEILHIFRPLRPGQVRGVSMFTPSVMRLRDTDDYADAELMRKKIAACFVAFVKRTAGPAASTLAGKNQTTESSTTGKRLEALRPGLINYMEAGDDVTFGKPPESEGYVEYMRFELHAIAAGIGVTYEQLTGDLSQVNYSSIRAGLVDFWDVLDQWQFFVAIPQLCQPIWNRVGQLQAAMGRRNAADSFDAIWTPPVRRWVDPAKEIDAKRKEIRSGLVTLPDAIAERGYDPADVLAEIAATNKTLDGLGIVLDTDPRKVSAAGLTQTPVPGDAGTDDAQSPNKE